MTLEVLVTRKIRDLVRDASEDVLVAKHAGVCGVTRGELWTFEVEGDTARRSLLRLLEETTLVVNPNVHRWALDSWRTPPEGRCRLLVVVSDEHDARGAAVLRAIRDRRGIDAVTGAKRSILWAIDLEGGREADALRLGEEITGADVGAGLLANRHAQDVHLEVVTN